MNRGAAALHRLSLGLIGVIALVVAVAIVLVRLSVDPVADWVARLDTARIADTVGEDWFAAVIAGVAVIALYWGWRLIRTTIAPRRPDVLTIGGSGPEGSMTIPLKQVARAVEGELTAQTILRDVRVQAIDDRGSKMILVSVAARPERSYDEVVGALASSLDDLRSAFDGTDVHVRALIHLEKRDD
ncbi:hypothetical protein [Gordonia shandongensis]|uniref:hypothetical protein n=1 Tax=Gordonia shandongensis TaxID=376351 RepID=UPI00040B8C7C|nr:hypothetical protein [Gordonia shandongensis]